MSLNDIKQNHKYILIGTGVMVLILLIILFASIFQNKTISYTAAEGKLKTAGIEYFSKDELPIEGESKSVTLETLVNEKIIKSFTELVGDDSCVGTVYVSNNNGNYLYTTELKCGENYETVLLADKIKADNPEEEDDSLYLIGNDLVFRGEYVNNFVEFSDTTWRITRINEDGTIELLHYEGDAERYEWDDRYNVERDSSVGINDYTVSRIKDVIDAYYESLGSAAKSYIVPMDICIGKNVSNASYDGVAECSETITGYASMIQLNQFAQASLDANCIYNTDEACTNYNYLSLLSGGFWSITANADNTYQAFKISQRPTTSTVSTSAKIRPVITITNQAVYTTGDGTLENPYSI